LRSERVENAWRKETEDKSGNQGKSKEMGKDKGNEIKENEMKDKMKEKKMLMRHKRVEDQRVLNAL